MMFYMLVLTSSHGGRTTPEEVPPAANEDFMNSIFGKFRDKTYEERETVSNHDDDHGRDRQCPHCVLNHLKRPSGSGPLDGSEVTYPGENHIDYVGITREQIQDTVVLY